MIPARLIPLLPTEFVAVVSTAVIAISPSHFVDLPNRPCALDCVRSVDLDLPIRPTALDAPARTTAIDLPYRPDNFDLIF